jgi:hypothetical protein
MERRRFLKIAGTAGVAVLAGCVGDGDSGSDDGQDGGEPDTGDGEADGDSGDGSGDDDTEGETETGDDTDGGDGASGGQPRLAESFVAEMTVPNPQTGEEMLIRMRRSGEDFQTTVDAGGGSFEVYYVDGDTYQVAGGQCFKNPPEVENPAPPQVPDVDEHQEFVQELPETHDRTETIDGDEVHVYEIDENTALDFQGYTLYVSVETRRIRRIEFEDWSIDYHSFGEVGSIEPPDMTCQELGGAGGGDGS